jgi:hypothetical protein
VVSLPEIIPPGEYILLADRQAWADLDGSWSLTVGDGYDNFGSASITEAQARHLLAMPGRPRDDRLDGRVDCSGVNRNGDHYGCWLNEERPCCQCGYTGDDAPRCPAQSPREDKRDAPT